MPFIPLPMAETSGHPYFYIQSNSSNPKPLKSENPSIPKLFLELFEIIFLSAIRKPIKMSHSRLQSVHKQARNKGIS